MPWNSLFAATYHLCDCTDTLSRCTTWSYHVTVVIRVLRWVFSFFSQERKKKQYRLLFCSRCFRVALLLTYFSLAGSLVVFLFLKPVFCKTCGHGNKKFGLWLWWAFPFKTELKRKQKWECERTYHNILPSEQWDRWY